MIWFDYLALGFLAYFVIRGFLSGFVRVVFSFAGMIVAFLYSGWLSLKISPYIENFITNHPKILPVLSYIIAFLLIYLSFVIAGFIILSILGKLNLTVADYILGAFLGFIKGVLFITIFYIALVLPYPASQKILNKAMVYPLVKYSLKFSSQFLPESWKVFLKKRNIEIS
ncbi:MAG: CvpA family protein [Thermodesulfobacterium sp.]|nr:CvpA family protein [Thermodesulfobacterium sp.]HEA83852.1 CvpA family protein [Thermodesulfobacterium geofontis]